MGFGCGLLYCLLYVSSGFLCIVFFMHHLLPLQAPLFALFMECDVMLFFVCIVFRLCNLSTIVLFMECQRLSATFLKKIFCNPPSHKAKNGLYIKYVQPSTGKSGV